MTKKNRCALIVAVAVVTLFSGGILLAQDGSADKNADCPARKIAKLLSDIDSNVEAKKIAAIDTLGHLAAKAPGKLSDVIDALVGQLESDSAQIQAHAAHALGQIGPQAKAAGVALVSLVVSENETLRREAVRALAKIRPGPKVVVPALAKLLADGSGAVRTSALHAIAEVGPPAVPMLIEALGNEKTDYWAMLVLAELGPEAKDAVPALTEQLSSERTENCREAMICLGKIGPASASAIPALEKLLGAKRGEAVLGVAYVLGSIGPEAKKAADCLKPYAADSDPLTRLACAWALARTNPGNKVLLLKATKVLAESLRSKKPQVRLAAVRGLASLKPGPGIAIPAIRKALAGADPDTLNAALDALASLGETSVPNVARVLQNKTHRRKAAMILARMGPKAKMAVPALVASLTDEDPKTRREIVFALGSIGPAAARAVPALIKSLDDKDMDVRYSAAFALGKIGPEAAAAEAVLGENLDSPDKFLALVSAWALVKITPDSNLILSKVMPLLVEGLGNSATTVRIEAAETLGILGPKAKAAIVPLRKLLADPNEQVKAATKKAIESIEK
ncbi:MAG: HEAT repeat domain-containing protein [Planctomycetota bacterium]|nr:HEAT repeat domain-containing protein [Planctomycetota bacterium]